MNHVNLKVVEGCPEDAKKTFVMDEYDFAKFLTLCGHGCTIACDNESSMYILSNVCKHVLSTSISEVTVIKKFDTIPVGMLKMEVFDTGVFAIHIPKEGGDIVSPIDTIDYQLNCILHSLSTPVHTSVLLRNPTLSKCNGKEHCHDCKCHTQA